MASKPASAEQKKWMDSITDYINENGLGVLYGTEYEYDIRMQRHHVTGRSSKQDKVEIGHWFILPVPFELHDPSMKHKHHVGHCKKAFVKRFGTQRSLFKRMYQSMKQQGYIVPNSHVFSAIMETSA